MMAIDGCGTITIVEIKVSRADLLGDLNGSTIWIIATAFLGGPGGFDLGPFEAECFPAGLCGLLVADATTRRSSARGGPQACAARRKAEKFDSRAGRAAVVGDSIRASPRSPRGGRRV